MIILIPQKKKFENSQECIDNFLLENDVVELNELERNLNGLKDSFIQNTVGVHFYLEIIKSMRAILDSTPNSHYNFLIALTDAISNELSGIFEKNHKNHLDESKMQLFVIAQLNLFLAERLETIGLYSRSYSALVKSNDPLCQPYDFLDETGQIEMDLQNILELDFTLNLLEVQFPLEINNFLIKRAYLLFKLATKLGNVNGESINIFEQYKDIVSKDNLTPIEINYYGYYLRFLVENSLDEFNTKNEIIEILKRQYSVEVNENNRFLVAFILGKTLKDKQWLELALNENTFYWEEYHEAVSLHVLLNDIDPKFSHELYTNVLFDFLNTAQTMCENKPMFELCKQKNSIVYTNLLEKCIDTKEYDNLLSISYNWNAIKFDSQLEQIDITDLNICLMIPNLKNYKGPFFVIKYKEIIKIFYMSSEVSLEELYTCKNKIEKTWNVVTGDEIVLNQDFVNGRREIEESVNYKKLIEDFIVIDELKKQFDEFDEVESFEYLETTWTNLPIIQMLNLYMKQTFYVTGGYNNKKPTKETQKALIWYNENRLPYAQFELSSLKDLLRLKGIAFEVIEKEQLTKNNFLLKYQDESIDLIWIITHGQFDYYNPLNSYLHLSDTEVISSLELQEYTVNRDFKRNIVLNACYSGCADVNHNGMGFLGIAPMLNSNEQDILGHLWFVHDLASATLGSFILSDLLITNDLAKSSQLATKNMQISNEEISKKISDIIPSMDLIDRVENTSIKLKEPFYSMSSIVYK